MIILNCEQRSDEWYAARKGVITASACKDIMSPAARKQFLTKTLSEILTGFSEPVPLTDPIKWGIDTEDQARQRYEKETGESVRQVGFVFMDEDRRVGCSPDGLVGPKGLIEIKCPMTKTHLSYLEEGDAPKHYFMQMQFQMMVTNRVWCDFVSFDPRLPESMQILIVRVPRCQETIHKIKASIQDTSNKIDDFLAKYGLKWKQ